MRKFYISKLIYETYYYTYLLREQMNKNPLDNSGAQKFVNFNNNRVMKLIKNNRKEGKIIKKIAILLPHCIQKYSCNLKITNNIENCANCGQCDISDILKLKNKFNGLDVKVATGGTLARLYLKEYKPDLVLAVACKRDLTSGIRDAFPMPVYGIFNKLVNGPCVDTKVSIEEIEYVLEEVMKK